MRLFPPSQTEPVPDIDYHFEVSHGKRKMEYEHRWAEAANIDMLD
jgi:hypothetical protein